MRALAYRKIDFSQFSGNSSQFSVSGRWLLVDAAGQKTSINRQHVAGDEAGSF